MTTHPTQPPNPPQAPPPTPPPPLNHETQTAKQQTDSLPHPSQPQVPLTYKQKLVESCPHTFFPSWLQNFDNHPFPFSSHNYTSQAQNHAAEHTLPFSEEELTQIRLPWKNALIIHTTGLDRTIRDIATHLRRLWHLTGQVQITDIGSGHYIARFTNTDEYFVALAGGPWFLFNHFLAITQWKPNYNPRQSTPTELCVWLQLPELPIEYYEINALAKIGRMIGRPVKVDLHTVKMERARYARICVHLDTSKPLPKAVQIGDYAQPIVYELKGSFCFRCGIIGHFQADCNYKKPDQKTDTERSTPTEQPNQTSEKNQTDLGWNIVTKRPRRGKQSEQEKSVPAGKSADAVAEKAAPTEGKGKSPATNQQHPKPKEHNSTQNPAPITPNPLKPTPKIITQQQPTKIKPNSQTSSPKNAPHSPLRGRQKM